MRMRSSRWPLRQGSGALAVGLVVGLSSACGPFSGGDETTSPSYEPVETTTTTDPSPTDPSTTQGDPKGLPPAGDEVLARAKNHMKVTSTVTIDGTLPSKTGDVLTLHTEGSVGGIGTGKKQDFAGASETTLTREGGGKVEMKAIGFYHYVKVDQKWFDAQEGRKASAKYVGTWLKVKAEDSPVNGFRPNVLINGTFFGEALTSFDADTASSSHDTVDGQPAYRLAVGKAGKQGKEAQRTMWVSAKADAPEMLQWTVGRDLSRTTLKFSKWNATNDKIKPPTGAKALTEEVAKDLGFGDS